MPQQYQIFPAIGIARVGDSPAHTYLASEAPNINHVPTGGYRGPGEPLLNDPIENHPYDAASTTIKRIKRMGCRFRIYEFDAAGNAISEITADDGDIEWHVQFVNKKAAGDADWGLGFVAPGPLNTGNVPGTALPFAAADLTIDTGTHTITGRNVARTLLEGTILTGSPGEATVKLGDIETDDRGRLIVYGGHGKSESWHPSPPAPSLVRNAGWYDDISDGIVEATVTINGVQHTALRARIVVGPPDYAHPCLALVTLFDLGFDRSGGWNGNPPTTSFRDHIHPILHRVCWLEWTLYSIEGGRYGRTPKHGHGGSGNHDMHPDGTFLEPEIFESLHDTSLPNSQLRRDWYLRKLKTPDGLNVSNYQGTDYNMPAIFGLTLTEVQFSFFQDLASGTFTSDWTVGADAYELPQPDWSEIPTVRRPSVLNRASMDFAVGGPFFPGVEVGAIVDQAPTWTTVGNRRKAADFRIDDAILPGDLTATLSVPWQCGFNAHSYLNPNPGVDPALPNDADNMWPSARPVLMPAVNVGISDDRMWTRPHTATTGSIFEQQTMQSNERMIRAWSTLGFLEPTRFYAEFERTLISDAGVIPLRPPFV